MTYSVAKTPAALGALLLTTLGACMAEMPAGNGMAPSASAPPFIEGSFSASAAAETSCRVALEEMTDGGVRVVGSEFSQASSAVYMRVGVNGAPWRCLVGDDGSNPSLMFMGDEGAA